MTDPWSDEPPTVPPCPRCHSNEAAEPGDAPWPWFCARCLCAYTGSASEAARHAAVQLAEKAEREAAAAALRRARGES